MAVFCFVLLENSSKILLGQARNMLENGAKHSANYISDKFNINATLLDHISNELETSLKDNSLHKKHHTIPMKSLAYRSSDAVMAYLWIKRNHCDNPNYAIGNDTLILAHDSTPLDSGDVDIIKTDSNIINQKSTQDAFSSGKPTMSINTEVNINNKAYDVIMLNKALTINEV